MRDCNNALRTCKETCSYWPVHHQTRLLADHRSTFNKPTLLTVSLATCLMLEVTTWAWTEHGRWVRCQLVTRVLFDVVLPSVHLSPSPPVDIVWAMMTVWRISGIIIRTALCCAVLCCAFYDSYAQWYAHTDTHVRAGPWRNDGGDYPWLGSVVWVFFGVKA